MSRLRQRRTALAWVRYGRRCDRLVAYQAHSYYWRHPMKLTAGYWRATHPRRTGTDLFFWS